MAAVLPFLQHAWWNVANSATRAQDGGMTDRYAVLLDDRMQELEAESRALSAQIQGREQRVANAEKAIAALMGAVSRLGGQRSG